MGLVAMCHLPMCHLVEDFFLAKLKVQEEEEGFTLESTSFLISFIYKSTHQFIAAFCLSL
jgi:hypothetical protein